MQMREKTKLVLALNTSSLEEALNWIEEFKDGVEVFKIGYPLLFGNVEDLIRRIKEVGKEVFLDTKFLDIPSVVRRGVAWARDVGADYITIHALGGQRMLEEAKLEKIENRPKLISVTVLSSLSNEDTRELQLERRSLIHVLTDISVRAKMDGIVVSGEDLKTVREKYPDLIIVCPGIRPSGSPINDQKAVLTPKRAIELGANLLVVGRAILHAKNPREVLRRIRLDMQ
jgi:orotidine-5'-phosphate decarboxylase